MLDSLQREVELLERTLRTLALVRANEPVGIRRVARETTDEHHEVRTAFRLLEREGLLEPTPDGAVTTDAAATFDADDELDAVAASLDELGTLVERPGGTGRRGLTTRARR